MKVAFITNVFPVLYNSFTANEIAQVVDRGVDVGVIALKRHASKARNEVSLKLAGRARYFDEFVRGFGSPASRFLLKHQGRVKHFSPKLHEFAGRVLFGGIRRQADRYRQKLGWHWYALQPLARFLKQQGFEMIHAGFGNRTAEAAMILSRLSGLPFSFEAHAFDLFVDFPFAQEKLSEAERIFTISEYNRNYLIGDLGCDPRKVVKMRVTFNRDYCDQVAVEPKDPATVVAVCRLHPIKGLDHAIDAIALVARARKDVRFLIVGDGPLETALKNKVGAMKLENNVKFLGSVGNERALEVIARAGVFLLPSVIAPDGDRDGIPTSMIEAMYLRTPVVSSRVSGIPELVDDGVNGLLAEPGDVRTLAEHVGRLINDEAFRVKMGERARDKVEHRFYERDTAVILMQEWQSIVEGRCTMHGSSLSPKENPKA